MSSEQRGKKWQPFQSNFLFYTEVILQYANSRVFKCP